MLGKADKIDLGGLLNKKASSASAGHRAQLQMVSDTRAIAVRFACAA
jgi:hypothetical protein